MSCILFAWQLGANYGHLMTDLPIAECLRKLGHDVLFAVPDPRIAAEILLPAHFPFFPVPLPQGLSVSAQPPASYAEIMFAAGCGDDLTLAGTIHGWLNLFNLTRPDVMVADHAPTALVAARLLDIPTMLIGNGFTVPPQLSPLPSIRPWETIPIDRLRRVEGVVLDKINALLAQHQKAPLDRLADLFAEQDVLQTTFAELDHYGTRPNCRYVGPISSDSKGQPIHWRATSQPRVFAYLRPTVPRIAAILTALEESGAQVICVMPGANAELQQHFAATELRLVNYPVPLTPLLSGIDVVVTYGGKGMITSSLLAAVPMLLVPQTAEQYLGSMQVAQLGAGIFIGLDQHDSEVAAALERLLKLPAYKEAAQRIANQHRDFDHNDAVNTAATMIANRANASRQ